MNTKRYVRAEDIAMDEEILKLIQQSEQPEQKATLLALLKISRSLTLNTDITRSLASDLEEHRKQFQSHKDLVAKGLGAWKAVGFTFTIIWALSAYIVNLHLNNLTIAMSKNEEQDRVLAATKGQVETLEKEMAGMRAVLKFSLPNPKP